ncbi:hypothetical protein PMAYCL1PPCAC_23149 [Pristionchus mayeri]|uniref:ADP-ribosylation factor-related protein 1 n=1 Tax=Pristionchus mayeri TaxID=1317129 RepID=A0AAN5CYE0_9BILA|nr:hypothetical protein PMAYCL1PPCAC_23149 [Pristionchus mayeri]
MYTLSVGLWEQFFKKKDYFVVIVGLDNAGKTTFLEQIKGKFVKNYPMLNPAKITSTVGLNIGKVEVDQARLNFWDVGGQEDLRCLWANYLDEASALIYVVDASRPDLLPTVAESFKEVMKVERVKEVPILVAVNKSELEGAITADQVCDLFDYRTLTVCQGSNGSGRWGSRGGHGSSASLRPRGIECRQMRQMDPTVVSIETPVSRLVPSLPSSSLLIPPPGLR